MRHFPLLAVVALSFAGVAGCKSKGAAPAKDLKVGLVTDVGGRGDGSFNDSALRGLELWAGGKTYSAATYKDASPQERGASIPAALGELPVLGITPLVLQSKAQEDYEPNLQLLVDQGAALVIGVGFMLENAVEAVARRNPDARFLLIDSPVLDAKGAPVRLPNVRTVTFREEQVGFLAGALAGLVSRTKVAFVGGMEVPLIKRFEVGFRAGLMTTAPAAAASALTTYTGSFDNVSAGKQVTADLLAKGVDVVCHAAGTDGLGVIQAVKEARAAGKPVQVIGVDSDQYHLAPEAMLSSMVKRVDVAVYRAIQDVAAGKFTAGDQVLGIPEQGVALAEVRADFPDKAKVLERVEALRAKVAEGAIQVPARSDDLAAFKAPL